MGWLPLFLSLRPLFFDSPLYSQPLSTFSFSSENSDHLRTVYIYIISTVLIAMSFTPLPSFGSTLPAARNTTVARDLSLPFRRDVDTWQAFSAPLNFKVLSRVNRRILSLIIFFNRIHRILALKLIFAMPTTRQICSVM